MFDLARSVAWTSQLVEKFKASQSAIHNWLAEAKVDRGELEGDGTDFAVECLAAKKCIAQLEADITVNREFDEISVDPDIFTKAYARRLTS